MRKEEHTHSWWKEIEGCNKKKKLIPTKQTIRSSEKETIQIKNEINKTASHDQ